MISIGSLSLDDSSAVVTSKYEYYRTTGGEIIGGYQLIQVKGSIVVGGPGQTGSIVMSKARQIVDLGKKTECISVNITGYYFGQAKINNVSVDEGSDPTWVNKADFSIEIKVPLQTIPNNSFGIVAQDCVTEISRSSKLELPEDSHGYVYGGGSFSKVYGVLSTELTVKCEPLCGANSFSSVINKLATNTVHPELSTYNGWNKYARSLSVQVGPENSATISKQYLITPHPSSAFVELQFEYQRSYQEKSKSKIISGTINGLTDASVFSNNSINGTCVASKLANAESALGVIRSLYSSLTSWEGISLELTEIPACPPPATGNNAPICDISSPNDDALICIEPKSSLIARSRTEGSINFTFEWSSNSGDCTDANGIQTDISVEVIAPQPQIVEFVIPLRGTLLQNLNTVNATRINIQINKTFPNACATDSCPIDINISQILQQYGGGANYILINDKITRSPTSIVIDKGYIQC